MGPRRTGDDVSRRPTPEWIAETLDKLEDILGLPIARPRRPRGAMIPSDPPPVETPS